MNKQVRFEPNKRKYIFIANKLGMPSLTSIIEQVKLNNLSFEEIDLNFGENQELPSPEMTEWLSQQRMGTYLYVALPYEKLNPFRRLIEEIGYSAEEYQCIGLGEKKIRVFCCRCHGISEAIKEISEVSCHQCQLQLEITDHFSSLKNAYLGYVAKL